MIAGSAKRNVRFYFACVRYFDWRKHTGFDVRFLLTAKVAKNCREQRKVRRNAAMHFALRKNRIGRKFSAGVQEFHKRGKANMTRAAAERNWMGPGCGWQPRIVPIGRNELGHF